MKKMNYRYVLCMTTVLAGLSAYSASLKESLSYCAINFVCIAMSGLVLVGVLAGITHLFSRRTEDRRTIILRETAAAGAIAVWGYAYNKLVYIVGGEALQAQTYWAAAGIVLLIFIIFISIYTKRK